MGNLVKCSDCGFLALRMTASRNLVDAEERFRRDGTLPSSLGADFIAATGPREQPTPYYEDYPLCFVRSADLRAEIGDDKWSRGKVVNQPRECGGFTPWHQGFTPKEHREMMNDEADRRWRERQEELAAQRHAQSLRVTWMTSMGSAAIGFIAAMVTVVLGYYLGQLAK